MPKNLAGLEYRQVDLKYNTLIRDQLVWCALNGRRIRPRYLGLLRRPTASRTCTNRCAWLSGRDTTSQLLKRIIARAQVATQAAATQEKLQQMSRESDGLREAASILQTKHKELLRQEARLSKQLEKTCGQNIALEASAQKNADEVAELHGKLQRAKKDLELERS